MVPLTAAVLRRSCGLPPGTILGLLAKGEHVQQAQGRTVHLGVPSVIADADGGIWQVTEEFLVNAADESEQLARIPTHMSFWFGWFQFHPDTELYTGP